MVVFTIVEHSCTSLYTVVHSKSTYIVVSSSLYIIISSYSSHDVLGALRLAKTSGRSIFIDLLGAIIEKP